MQVTMITAVFAILFSLLATRCHGSFHGGTTADARGNPQHRHRHVSISTTDASSSAVDDGSGAVIRPSPECWKSAMTAFYLNTTPLSENDAKVFCQHMHEDHQKVLALMISQCHLEDLGKALMDDPVVLQDCLQRAATSRDVLLACLKRLTDAGVTAYTHYVAYVQQFCTRLTQELAVQLQVDAHRVMAQRYERLSNESLQHLESIQSWQSNFLDTFRQSFERELQLQLHVRLPETLKHQVNQVMQHHATEQARMVEDLMESLKDRQSEQQERQEEWLNDKVNLVQRYLEELERQHEKLQEQQTKMDTLSETIASVAHDVVPLAGLYRLFGVVTSGYAWMSLVLRSVAGMLLLRFLTRPKRLQPSRFYLFALQLLQIIAEASLWGLAHYGWMSEVDRNVWLMRTRHWTLVLGGVTCCLSFVASFYRLKVEPAVPSPSLSNLKLELDELRQLHEHMMSTLTLGKHVNSVDEPTVNAAPSATSLSPRMGRFSHETFSAYTQPDWPLQLGSAMSAAHHLKPRVAPNFLAYNNPRSAELHGLSFERFSPPVTSHPAGGDAYTPFAALPTAYPRSQVVPVPVSHVPDHRHWLPVYPPSPMPHASAHFPNNLTADAPSHAPRGHTTDAVSPAKIDATQPPPVPAWSETRAADPHSGSPRDADTNRKKRDGPEIATNRAEKKPRTDTECEISQTDP